MISRLFHSLIGLVTAIFFLLLGIMCLMLPWSSAARTDLIQLILEDSKTLALFGFGFTVIGASIIIYIVSNARHRYYYLAPGSRSIKIDENVIQDYLESYWKQLFPHIDVPTRFALKRNKIHVTADLPYIPPGEQKEFLEQVREDLSHLLENFIGYRKPLSLSASFQSEPKLKR